MDRRGRHGRAGSTGEIEEIPKAKSGRGALFLNLAVALLVRFPADSALNQA
jgi:hypothetical protein